MFRSRRWNCCSPSAVPMVKVALRDNGARRFLVGKCGDPWGCGEKAGVKEMDFFWAQHFPWEYGEYEYGVKTASMTGNSNSEKWRLWVANTNRWYIFLNVYSIFIYIPKEMHLPLPLIRFPKVSLLECTFTAYTTSCLTRTTLLRFPASWMRTKEMCCRSDDSFYRCRRQPDKKPGEPRTSWQ